MNQSHMLRVRSAEPHAAAHRRLSAEAHAALDALLALSAGGDEPFFGKIGVELSVQNGKLVSLREITERTRK